MSASSSPNATAPRPIRVLLAGIDRISRIDGWLGALSLLLLTLLMIAEVSLRALSNVTSILPAHIPVAWEWSSYLMAAAFTFGAAMTLRAGGHIRVSLLLANVPQPFRRGLEFSCALIGFAFMTFLTYAMVKFTYGSFERGQTAISSNTPLWIPQTVVTFGLALLAIQFLGRVIQVSLRLPLEDERFRASTSAE